MARYPCPSDAHDGQRMARVVYRWSVAVLCEVSEGLPDPDLLERLAEEMLDYWLTLL